MYVVIPHVGKSHLTRETILSVPSEHRVVLIDASYVADLDVMAANMDGRMVYVRPPETPTCLAHNWNLGASKVPESEPYWLFCASDIQFHQTAWRRLNSAIENYPDAAIIKDDATNWNVWLVRRWAWDLLAPMDERYTPCGGEDDDLVMKCQALGLKIRPHNIGVNHLEGGHATRLDIRRDLAGTDWSIRRRNIDLFKRKWGCIPAKGRDPIYRAAITETHIRARRAEPPSEVFTPPTKKLSLPLQETPREWPTPLRLHLGVGLKRRHMEGFVNVDANARLEPDLVLDVTRDPWPWPAGSADRIESYHFIEHLGRDAGEELVRKSFETLKPGGVFVVECPDLDGICALYHRSTRRMRKQLYGDQRNKWRYHFWGYCKRSMKVMLDGAGFSSVTVSEGTDYHAKQGPCLRAEAVK